MSFLFFKLQLDAKYTCNKLVELRRRWDMVFCEAVSVLTSTCISYTCTVTIATLWKLVVQLFSLSLSPFPFFSWQSLWLLSMPRFASTSKIIPFTSKLRRSVSLWNLRPSLVHWVSQPIVQSCENTLCFTILSAKLNSISSPGLVSVNNLFLYLFTLFFVCFPVLSILCLVQLNCIAKTIPINCLKLESLA